MTAITQEAGLQYVVFSINDQMYSLLIEEVVEILRVPLITEVPGINENIEGVINLRGSIIPILNLHKRFSLPLPTKNKKNRIVIVQGRNENIGLMVEEVKMVSKFEREDVEPTSGNALKEDVLTNYAKYEDQVIGVLNLEKLLYD